MSATALPLVDFPGTDPTPQSTTTKGQRTINKVVDPNDPVNNRFIGKLNEMKQTAAFGLYLPDVMKAKTGTDYTKDIQFSIRREFWTLGQVNHIIYWSLSFGAVIGAGVIAGLTPGVFPDILGPSALMIWGVFILTLGLTGMVGQGGAKRNIRKCSSKKYEYDDPNGTFKKGDHKVEVSFRGKDCLTDWDCTRGSKISKGVCKAPEPFEMAKAFRKGMLPIITLIGAVLTGISFSSTDFRLAKKDLAQAIIYGIGIGNFLILFFS